MLELQKGDHCGCNGVIKEMKSENNIREDMEPGHLGLTGFTKNFDFYFE